MQCDGGGEGLWGGVGDVLCGGEGDGLHSGRGEGMWGGGGNGLWVGGGDRLRGGGLQGREIDELHGGVDEQGDFDAVLSLVEQNPPFIVFAFSVDNIYNVTIKV